MNMNDLDYLLKRFWEEADKEDSFDLGELALTVVPKLEKRIGELEAYRVALEIIANIEKKTEQKTYGTVVYTPTLESIQRFARQVLNCPGKAMETLNALAELEKN